MASRIDIVTGEPFSGSRHSPAALLKAPIGVTTAAVPHEKASTVVPSAIGLLFLGDEVRSGFALVATAGFLIAVSGATCTSRTPSGRLRVGCARSVPGSATWTGSGSG